MTEIQKDGTTMDIKLVITRDRDPRTNHNKIFLEELST